MALSRASILAVGTEITTGEIVNSNASWIASRLVDLGFEVVLHETVADEATAIQQALTRCAEVSDLVFVSGGLGPTTDDFTRDVIAAWTQLPLEYDDGAWQKIVKRLTSLQAPIAASNRRQCYFPRGAQILDNREGTANAFFLTYNNRQVWVLPGPPKEIASVWHDHIEGALKNRIPPSDRLVLRQWHCIGQSESALGETVEEVLKGSPFLIGYRTHMPYVTIKVWHKIAEEPQAAPWLAKLEQALSPWVVTHDQEDLAHKFLTKLIAQGTVHLLDAATLGHISERLGVVLRKHTSAFGGAPMKVTTLAGVAPVHDQIEQHLLAHLHGQRTESLTLAVFGIGLDGSWAIGMKKNGQIRTLRHQSRYRGQEFLGRSRLLVSELAIKQWIEWL